ncbi:hypothetical protein BDW59DRAFT_149546 [Aspergillus cavernicola]|uniref:Uncharacterized protein n=1 Tax=Aspergillus cavernicola TaxID=176166 RepID=A0ABR4I3M8_9EURO
MADLVQILRGRDSAGKQNKLQNLGAASICLSFLGPVTINPSNIQPMLRAVFSVHISNLTNQQDADQFIAWIQNLPESASITVEGLYPTGPACWVLTSAWSVWSKLAGIRGYRLIAEAKGANALSINQGPATARPTKKANIP